MISLDVTIMKELLSEILSLQQNPTEAELQDMIDEMEAEAYEMIDFPEFLSEMTRRMKVKDTEEELVGILKVLNRDENDVTNSAESCHLMTSMGEKLTNEEVDEMVQWQDVDVTRVRSCKVACKTCVKDNMVTAAGETIVAGKNDPTYLESKGLNHPDRSVEARRR